jgi:putative sterol carrier protein
MVKGMAEKEKLTGDLINSIAKRINENSEKTKGWGKAIKLVFTDIAIVYWMKLSMDGTVEATEHGSIGQLQNKEAVATLRMTTDTFAGLINGSVSPIATFLKGEIKIEGSMEALMKLASAFGVG